MLTTQNNLNHLSVTICHLSVRPIYLTVCSIYLIPDEPSIYSFISNSNQMINIKKCFSNYVSISCNNRYVTFICDKMSICQVNWIPDELPELRYESAGSSLSNFSSLVSTNQWQLKHENPTNLRIGKNGIRDYCIAANTYIILLSCIYLLTVINR